MAEPWSDDFAALGEATRRQLRSIAATRAACSPEPTMNLVKRRPVLSMCLAAAVLAIAAPAAYALGHRILLSFDPAEPAPAIQQDVQHQLDTAGVKATVHVEKTDGKLRVHVQSNDPSAPNIEFPELGSANQNGRRVRVSIEGFNEKAPQELDEVLQSAPVAAALGSDVDPETAEETVTDALSKAGFRSVEVEVDEHWIQIHATVPEK